MIVYLCIAVLALLVPMTAGYGIWRLLQICIPRFEKWCNRQIELMGEWQDD